MKILVIGNLTEKKEKLVNTLSMSFPSYTFENCVMLGELTEKNQRGIRLLVIFLSENNNLLLEQLEQLECSNIPLLFVENGKPIALQNYLNRFQVKGYVQRNASLDTIKNAIRLVLKGGIYMEPSPFITHFVPKTIDNKKEEFNKIEWLVFSMISKGFTEAEVSQTLQIPLNQVHEQIKTMKHNEISPDSNI